MNSVEVSAQGEKQNQFFSSALIPSLKVDFKALGSLPTVVFFGARVDERLV